MVLFDKNMKNSKVLEQIKNIKKFILYFKLGYENLIPHIVKTFIYLAINLN